MANMHHRHVPPKESTLSGIEIDAENETRTGSAKKEKQKKRKKSRMTKKRGLEQLLGLGMFGMGMVMLCLFLRRGVVDSGSPTKDEAAPSSSLETTRLISAPSASASSSVFQLYSDKAPACAPLQSISEVSYTLVTQLSHDRLWMMEHHCQRYPHPMSIAVWTNHTMQETLEELQNMNCDMNILQVQIINAQTSGSSFDDYPVNALRNLALSQVTTSHIIYIDVDFWTSDVMYDILNMNGIRHALVQDPQLALVIPAFMLFRQCQEWTDCRELNLPHMPFSLNEMADMLRNKRGFIFDPTNKGGHGSTLYKEWLSQEPGSLLDIDCLQSNRYEPFVVVRYCHDLPPFQPAFSGYGKNKMTWMMQVIRRGYALKQVGGAFLVHYPHLDSSSRQKWNEAPQQLQVGGKDQQQPQQQQQVRRPRKSDGDLQLAEYKRGQVDQLFVDFREWLDDQVPDVSRVQQCESAQDDDSKLWIDHAPILVQQ